MERIQKFLAHQGVASRRQVDQMLQDGRITVNGKPASPGDQVAVAKKLRLMANCCVSLGPKPALK